MMFIQRAGLVLVFISFYASFLGAAPKGSSGGRSPQVPRAPEQIPAPENKHERSILEAPPARVRRTEGRPQAGELAPIPMFPARALSADLSDRERQIARLVLELYNLDQDRQCSTYKAESTARRIVRNPDNARQILEELYERISRKEERECNPEYLHSLMKEKFAPLKDIAPERFEEQKGFTLEQFRFVEESIAKVTGRLDNESRRDSPLQSPFHR